MHCFTTSYSGTYSSGALFNAAGYAEAQVDIGAGRIVYNMLATTCTTGCANGCVGVTGPAVNR